MENSHTWTFYVEDNNVAYNWGKDMMGFASDSTDKTLEIKFEKHAILKKDYYQILFLYA